MRAVRPEPAAHFQTLPVPPRRRERVPRRRKLGVRCQGSKLPPTFACDRKNHGWTRRPGRPTTTARDKATGLASNPLNLPVFDARPTLANLLEILVLRGALPTSVRAYETASVDRAVTFRLSPTLGCFVVVAKNQAVKVIIVGAAGRDFHDFNVFWRNDPRYQVVAFTAAQIPDIAGRTYPPELCGDRYPNGVPIEPEEKLVELIKKHQVDQVVMAYSDVAHEDVMHKAAIANAAGADFRMLGCRSTMLKSTKPVVAVCAVRTGCGKSQTSRAVSTVLKSMGKRVAAVRHPMPYGDLTKQICQRFATLEDLDLHHCTIEEREEYEPHIRAGSVIFAGVDYERILREAEKEADVILWDGGNNDMSFFKPDLYIVVADPHRPGHEVRYYPGETNARMADVVVVNKVDTAKMMDIETVETNIRTINPRAKIIRAASPVTVDEPEKIKGKRVLVVEDGPTLTHGDMTFGAAHVAARAHGASVIVDPRPFAVGTIKETFKKYPHVKEVLPAMGYGKKQMKELEQTINATECDVVLIGTPIDLGQLLKLNKPALRVRYELDAASTTALRGEIEGMLKRVG